MALFEGDDTGFNIGRGLAYFCAWAGERLSIWPIVAYYLLMLAAGGAFYFFSTDRPWNPFSIGLALLLLVLVPLILVIRTPRVWCRVPTQRDLASLRRHNRLD